jgi:hypothetical protein
LGTFLERVRHGKVQQPRHRAFDPAVWRSAYETLRTDDADDELFKAGLWFHARLPVLWDRVTRSVNGLSRPMLLRFLCGAATLESLVSERELLNAARRRDAARPFAHSLFQQKIAVARGTEVTADQIFSCIGDAFSLGLDYVLRAVPETGSDRAAERSERTSMSMRELLLLFQIIEMLEHLWARCLYLHLRLEPGEMQAVFRYQDSAIPAAVAIADHQSRSREITSALAMRELWRAGGAPPHRIKPIDRFELKGGRLRFSLWLPRPGKDEIPSGVLARHGIETSHIEDFLDVELPNQPGLTLNHLLDAFEALHSLAIKLRSKLAARLRKNEEAGRTGTLRTVLDMAPEILAEDLVRLVAKAAGMDRIRARNAIAFLTYEGKARDGVWAKPLIAVRNGFVVLALDAIHRPNAERMLDHWLIDGGLSASERGPRFEAYARRSLAAAAMSNPRLAQSFRVCPRPAVIGPKGQSRDIDLLMRLGSTVFIGELKCKVFPVTPKDLRWHLDEIERAAGQAKLRAELARDALPELAAKLEFRGSSGDLEVVPFVMINSEVGIGRAVGGVPVIDLNSLLNYLRDGALGMASDDDGRSRVLVDYYRTAAEAERNMRLYLEETPSVSLRRQYLREAVYRNADPVIGGLDIVEFGVRVEVPETEDGPLRAAREIKEGWHRRVATTCFSRRMAEDGR